MILSEKYLREIYEISNTFYSYHQLLLLLLSNDDIISISVLTSKYSDNQVVISDNSIGTTRCIDQIRITIARLMHHHALFT